MRVSNDAVMVELRYIKEAVHELRDFVREQNGRVSKVERGLVRQNVYWKVLIAIVGFLITGVVAVKGWVYD